MKRIDFSKLISFSKTLGDLFLTVVTKLRKKAATIQPPNLEEITKEVEIVSPIGMAEKIK